MSVAHRLVAGERVDVDELAERALEVAFGDRIGTTLFLASLVWFGLYWRLGFLSNDQLTFANGLVALADGHLHIERVVYGPASGRTPGTYLSDGRVYARNYGVLVPSLVWFTLLRGLALLADLRVLLVGGWALALLGTVGGVGRAFGRPALGRRAGALLGGTAFVAGLAVVTPLSDRWLPLIALQSTTALSAALTVTVLYRLASRIYTRRVGVFAGLIAGLATPLGFWATLPKRHAVSALLVVVAMYALYRSRESISPSRATRFRALAYATVGPAAWVHAAEGFLLLVALAVVDLPTARSNRPRRLAPVAGALALSLVPFLLTNALVSGNPLLPPRLLPAYATSVPAAVPTTGGAGTTGGGTGSSGSTAALPAVVGTILGPVRRVLGLLAGSFGLVVTDPGRLVDVFVRSGYVPGLEPTQDAAVNLSVLESMPTLAALAGAVVSATVRLADPSFVPRIGEVAGSTFARTRKRARLESVRFEPVTVVDLFAVVYALGLLGLFLGRLPTHHMLTVRYLHPLYALCVYWLVRTLAVRRAVETAPGTLAGAAIVGVVVGVSVYVGALAVFGLTLAEGVQLYALLALAGAGGLGTSSVLASLDPDRDVGTLALALGLVGGVSAAFLLVSGVALFPVTGEFLLPVGRVVHEAVDAARLTTIGP